MPVLRKNQNRFRKVYPGVRKSAVFDTALQIEAGEISLSDASSGTYTFKKSFKQAPAVTATVYNAAADANVNVVISAISETSVTIETSAAITGKVHVQIIEV
tara:strand:+ start:1104 stop:1409 length:306 start_codon:yes stop_codon:yes gene_type:complete